MGVLTSKIPETVDALLSRATSVSALNATVACTVAWAVAQLVRARSRVRTPDLAGPPNPSVMYGVGMLMQTDPASQYEKWWRTYGSAYVVPTALWGRKIVLYDPRAIAHMLGKQGWTYIRTPMMKRILEQSLGRGVFWADGENHKRQRRSLTPAFSTAGIRELTPVFYDAAHKASAAWNALIEASDGESAIIEVQAWMDYISIDSIAIAGFSHDFGALDGNHGAVTDVIDALNSSAPQSAWSTAILLLTPVFPILVRVPTARTKLLWKFNAALEEISNVLIARTKQELEMGVIGGKEEKSIIGLLIKGAAAEAEFHLSKEEVLSQMKALLLAGYESTAVNLTWALVELSRNPDVQTKLRDELFERGSDSTYDQLTNDLPYLDAVVHETLRLHAPVPELTRRAVEDDLVPFSQPIRTKSGQLIESLLIAKGTTITIPIASINTAVEFWGEDAKVFKPSRWLEDAHGHNGIPAKARELQGHRHLLTFSDGPRICLGRAFALAELKAVLSVLVKNFVFELRDGVDTKVETRLGFLPRPYVAGEVGFKVPLRVKPYVG